jgi:uncharacterized protein (DUF1697 family)
MPTVVAFLRAINVGGRFLKMADLSAHFTTLGAARVSTYINSGNVLFDTRARDLARLASTLQTGLEPLLGFRSEVFLRTAAEVHDIAQHAQALLAQVPPDGDVNVAFLQAPLDPEQVEALQTLETDLDAFVHRGHELVWLCQGSQSQSRFSNAVLERRLRLRCTFRRARMLGGLSAQLQGAPRG